MNQGPNNKRKRQEEPNGYVDTSLDNSSQKNTKLESTESPNMLEIEWQENLFDAAKEGDLDTINRLLTYPLVREKIAAQRNRAFNLACQHGHLDVANRLLNFFAVRNKIKQNQERFSLNSTPMAQAAKYGHLHIVNLLLKNRSVISNLTNWCYWRYYYFCHPLNIAARYGQLDVVERLLEFPVVALKFRALRYASYGSCSATEKMILLAHLRHAQTHRMDCFFNDIVRLCTPYMRLSVLKHAFKYNLSELVAKLLLIPEVRQAFEQRDDKICKQMKTEIELEHIQIQAMLELHIERYYNPKSLIEKLKDLLGYPDRTPSHKVATWAIDGAKCSEAKAYGMSSFFECIPAELVHNVAVFLPFGLYREQKRLEAEKQIKHDVKVPCFQSTIAR